MANLFFAQEELQYAKQAIQSFSLQKQFTPTNKDWADFLIHLELVFIKAERGCQDIKDKFLPFQGYYKKLRREDQLLSYLKNARDAVSHDNIVIIDLEIINKNKIIDYIELEVIDKQGNKRKEKHPLFPAAIKLKPFYINGKRWNPPVKHLGSPLLPDRDPIECAYLGIKFYQDFLEALRKKFNLN